MIKVSIIMPVYNDASKLQRSIDSVFKQTLKSIELICIDDGSTDNSLDILKDYAGTDNRIRILSQNNQGPGKARNRGILESKGEYIAFLDSDDYFIDENALFQLYSEAKKRDMNMVSGNIQFFEKGEFIYEHMGFKLAEELTIKDTQDYGLPWYFYKNMFKRSFLIENNILFPDLIHGEDPIFLAKILTSTDKYLEVPVLYYSYFTPTQNKINTFDRYIDYFRHFHEVFKLFTSNKKFQKMIEQFTEIMVRMKNRDIHIYTKNQLYELLDVMDMIKSTFVEFGDETLVKVVSNSFDELLNKIYIEDLEIMIYPYENSYDVYSEGVAVIDKTQHPKMTVVVPVYNVEKYLSECLDSIINQTLNDIEIICINDGSTDNSLNILNEYAKIDERIKVYSFGNKGLGPARNRGIKRAHGEYVAFIDSDDWLELDFCEKIYAFAKKDEVDLVLFNAIEEYSDHTKKRVYFAPEVIETPSEFIFDHNWNSNFMLNTYLTAWSKLYRTVFLKENLVEFKSTLFEDIRFHVESYLKAKKISYNPTIFYHYRKDNQTSIINNLKNDECYCIIEIMDDVENILKENYVYEKYEPAFIKFKINQFREKLDLTSDVFKWDFIKKIKKELTGMNLNDDELNKLPEHINNFYTTMINSNSYYDYITLTNDMKKELSGEISLNFHINPNFLLIDEINDELTKYIQNDLLENNLINLRAYESVIEEEIFNDYYSLEENGSLAILNYIYSIKNNPLPFFDEEFYSNNYQMVKQSKCNPLVYYMMYGRFEGKDKLNSSIDVQPINRRAVYKKINELKGNQLSVEKRNPKVIITLTSFPERINDIIYTLYSLFNQTIKADEIILYLAIEEFPKRELDLPEELLRFREFGLKIRWCENILSYKKLIPPLVDYPHDILITVDDDNYYIEKWLEILLNEHEKFPNDIISHRARKINVTDEKIDDYNSWPIITKEEESSFLNFITGVGGVLYPPHCLHDDVLKKDIFMEICPHADDAWFWAMAIKKNTKIRVPPNCIHYLKPTEGLKELNLNYKQSLWTLNEQGRNDAQLEKIFEYYPEILDKMF